MSQNINSPYIYTGPTPGTYPGYRQPDAYPNTEMVPPNSYAMGEYQPSAPPAIPAQPVAYHPMEKNPHVGITMDSSSVYSKPSYNAPSYGVNYSTAGNYHSSVDRFVVFGFFYFLVEEMIIYNE